MYSFSVTTQLVVFVESVGFGVIIAVCYGVINIAVGVFASGRVKTVVADTLFSLVCAVALFGFILAYNLGKLRFYMVLGIIIGLTAYSVSIGNYLESVGERITAHFKGKKLKKIRKSLAKEEESVV